ncbi:hypothetical protein OXYTRIMIC_586 [Oxytricha trifallax]|uniref:Uncharacterized protein n=1 Tax=Oxytricha trifallax TaxID=1172189 RepID=A0A073I006_9SPIT|nr:hypothetical protein OXYTRIMIC_586 [Oxytricha trifallax]
MFNSLEQQWFGQSMRRITDFLQEVKHDYIQHNLPLFEQYMTPEQLQEFQYQQQINLQQFQHPQDPLQLMMAGGNNSSVSQQLFQDGDNYMMQSNHENQNILNQIDKDGKMDGKKKKKKSKLDREDPLRLKKVTGYMLFLRDISDQASHEVKNLGANPMLEITKYGGDKWVKLPNEIKTLYNKIGIYMQSNPPTFFSDIYTKECIEYLKRQVNFPYEYLDSKYEGFKPKCYGGPFRSIAERSIIKNEPLSQSGRKSSGGYNTYYD